MRTKTIDEAELAELRLAYVMECIKHADFCRDLAACGNPRAFCRKWGLTFEDGAGERAVANFHDMRRELGRALNDWPAEYLIPEISEHGGMLPNSAVPIRLEVYWDVTKETRDEARRRILKELTATLDTEINRVENEAEGLPDRAQARWAHEYHMAWLFRYQARHESAARIAQDQTMTCDRAVTQAVRRAAQAMGMILRPALPKGRRK
jgi:hypothetical protein